MYRELGSINRHLDAILETLTRRLANIEFTIREARGFPKPHPLQNDPDAWRRTPPFPSHVYISNYITTYRTSFSTGQLCTINERSRITIQTAGTDGQHALTWHLSRNDAAILAQQLQHAVDHPC